MHCTCRVDQEVQWAINIKIGHSMWFLGLWRCHNLICHFSYEGSYELKRTDGHHLRNDRLLRQSLLTLRDARDQAFTLTDCSSVYICHGCCWINEYQNTHIFRKKNEVVENIMAWT